LGEFLAISGALELLFHSMEAPWWLSSVFPIVSVRSALFPLMVRQTKSMRSRQELKPEMAEIRARYETDRQKQQEAVMELYRKRRVNPLGGVCPSWCRCRCSSRCTKSCAATSRAARVLPAAASSGR
jgi:YidC/Oxa1 family membrane protein insertase